MTSVRDIIVICILLFVVGTTLLLVVNMGHRINVQLLQTQTFNTSIPAAEVIQNADAAIDSTDYIYLALFIGFFISIAVTGWFVGGVPILAPIYFFVVTIFSFIGVILQLVFQDISLNANIINATANLPITTFILTNLGYFTVAMGLLGIIAMFAKPTQ